MVVLPFLDTVNAVDGSHANDWIKINIIHHLNKFMNLDLKINIIHHLNKFMNLDLKEKYFLFYDNTHLCLS